MFTAAERSWFFGPAHSTYCSTADRLFLERYCAPDRAGPTGHQLTGTASRLAPVPPSTARRILDIIASRVPSAAHSSPTYNWPAALQPLITAGRICMDGRIRGMHFGLIVAAGSIRLWVHESRITELIGAVPADWAPVPVGCNTRAVVASPALHDTSGNPSTILTNRTGTVSIILDLIEQMIGPPPRTYLRLNLPRRRALNEPWIANDQPPWSVLYPRLVNQ